ncbi:replication initiation and membrane attachment family protein [Bacillus sp. FJAT-29814]|uniref:replication initiation and membrane attachment family protein n=1 Tax=Bacillus sp. FJAT-29814 TaxID=1729688 RepID=UPI00082CE805|nr:replication initiation and membrane attachment family protein [Bacillus sp. FJAT-29814]
MVQHWQEILPIDRYIVTANGLLHDYDRKVLTFLYQPLIGSSCLSLYMTLWAELEENRLWGETSTHHLLMNLLGVNLNDIYEARLKLEGIGLLKCYVKNVDGERSFIYELYPPLNPEQFFLDGMLNIFLYRKIGKNHFARLKRFFSDQKIPKEEYHDVTRAFQDVFEAASPASMEYIQGVSGEIKAEENQHFIGRTEADPIQIDQNTFDFDLLMAGLKESLVPKKALTPKVKNVISNLAFLYGINAIEMKNFILGALNEHDEIDIEDLRKGARDWYQFVHYDQLPSLVERTQPPVYKSRVVEPKTKDEQLIHYFENVSPLKVLTDLSDGGTPPSGDIKIIEDIMITQKLLPGVVNVLIWYVMLLADKKFTKSYVEKIAGHWARLQLKTVMDAIEYARKDYKEMENKKAGWAGRKKPVRKELIPDWFDNDPAVTEKISPQSNDTDIEAKKRAMEEKLKAFRK